MNSLANWRDGLVAIIPAYNEEDAVGTTVRHVQRIGCKAVIVVDDGSRDRTAERAEKAGATVVRFDENRGKGAALAAGVKEATDDATIFLFVDADLESSAENLVPLALSVNSGTDIAIACFKSDGGFGVAKRLASSGIKLLTGRYFESPLSGQRALSKRAASLIGTLPGGWGIEVGMTVTALGVGMSVIEIPIQLTHRVTGRDIAGFVHRGKQCAAIIGTLCNLGVKRWNNRPSKCRGNPV